MALKFIGLPLNRIKVLVVEQKRLLDRALDAVREAQSSAEYEGESRTDALRKIIDVMEMQTIRTGSCSITTMRFGKE